MRTLALPLLAAALLAACGSGTTPAAPPPATNLIVRVDPDGPHGSARAHTVRLRCPGAGCAMTNRFSPHDFAPTPAGQACNMIYGGPETATVRGTLRGDTVNAAFSRTNGCQTSRWERVKTLLSAP